MAWSTSTWTLRYSAALVGVAVLVGSAAAQEDDDELPDYRPGLVAEFVGPGDTRAVRVDETLQFRWRGGAPDRRLASGPFQATWRGRLFSIVPGPYRFAVRAVGRARLTLAGQTVAEVDSPAGQRTLVSAPVKLDYGYHPLELHFVGTSDAGEVGVYWEGPQFGWEPIPAWYLMHEPTRTPPAAFDQGRTLVRALRCTACHELPGAPSPIPAPSLAFVRGHTRPEWLVEWLSSPPPEPAAWADPARTPRRMPYHRFSEAEASDVAAYLLSVSRDAPKPKPWVPKPEKPPARKTREGEPLPPPPRTRPEPREGEKLVRSLGCLACHRVDDLGAADVASGGDLTAVARKRTPEFFAHWFDDPARVNPDHRMPVFTLSEWERADLVAYLGTRTGPAAALASALPTKPEATPDADETALQRGRKLVETARCQACHAIGERPAEPVRLGGLRGAAWDRSCLTQAEVAGRPPRPYYPVPPEARAAIEQFVAELAPPGGEPPPLDGRAILSERRCLECHARNGSPGISLTVAAVGGHDADLLPQAAYLAPPALTGVGDKLPTQGLLDAVSLRQPGRRPWLAIRMPKFRLSEAEQAALAEYLVDADRMPPLPRVAPPESDPTAESLAGPRLVTTDGFGCTSCHQIGDSIPTKVQPGARGTDLSLVGQRVRREWFDRWVRNPARMIPRMEMPAIQTPVRGVLEENLDRQLAAVWRVLNEPGFSPPKPNPLRVVRARNVEGVAERAQVVSDLVVAGEQTFVWPIVVGLPNRHNLLFDRETGGVAGWWVGDTARLRADGKYWYWEAGAKSFMDRLPEPPVLILPSGERRTALVEAQCIAEFDAARHVPDGVEFMYRLRFPGDNPDGGTTPAVRTLHVRETWTAWVDSASSAATPASGVTRELRVEGLRPGERVEFAALLGAVPLDKSTAAPRGFAALVGRPRAEVLTPERLAWQTHGDRARVVLSAATDDATPTAASLRYLAELPVDRFPVEPPAGPPATPVRLTNVPGFDAVRLPLPADEMPTGLAWLADGTLVVCSLKGTVLEVRDTNADGYEDTYVRVSDVLPAPYGLATGRDAEGREFIDVAAKYGIVRLYDDDGDRFHERSEVVASGWGYTNDYHDWTVGLPRNAEGAYYVGLPCQQDDRSPAAARYRGQVLRLVPRKPSADDPRRFRLESLTRGHRFPMGLALSEAGDLFTTDNQGNYTPFNELNHLRAGRWYGFVNRLERSNPPREPVESPAVEIPHPWTRSVNGLAWLAPHADAPDAAKFAAAWGPLAGQLIGCEYNGQRLVRFSLEPIEGTFQGAVFPLDVPAEPGAPVQEGPVVAAISPAGDLIVGNLRDSAWGGGQNTGSLVRLRPLPGELPAGLAEIRSAPGGFRLRFTRPVDRSLAAERSNYQLEAFRRVATPSYGGDDVDRHAVRVTAVGVSEDGREVRLAVEPLRAGFVYSFHVRRLLPDQGTFHPDEGYFTLRRLAD